MTDFQAAVDIIFRVEGYDQLVVDSGGLTKWGISKNANPDLDIASLTRAQAAEVYRARYWQPVRGDDLPWPLALFVFDAAVNQGVEPAARMLQEVVNVAQDGRIGPKTLRAINARDADETAALYMARRALRYFGTKGFDVYGRGWLARLFRVANAA